MEVTIYPKLLNIVEKPPKFQQQESQLILCNLWKEVTKKAKERQKIKEAQEKLRIRYTYD